MYDHFIRTIWQTKGCNTSQVMAPSVGQKRLHPHLTSSESFVSLEMNCNPDFLFSTLV